MKAPELMISLLKEMAESPDGSILLLETQGMDEVDRRRLHNGELLADAALAVWKDDSILRITDQGYEFLKAVEKDKSIPAKFAESLRQGAPVASAVARIIELVTKF